MPSVCVAFVVLQMSAGQMAMGFTATVVVALIGALATHWAQSRRFERVEGDVAACGGRFEKVDGRVEAVRTGVSVLEHRLKRFDDRLSAFERRIAALEAECASLHLQPRRVDWLELDLVVLLARKNVTVGGALIDAFTDRLWYDAVRTVELATFLRRVDEDPLMRQMAELIGNMHAHNVNPKDVKRVYEGLKRQLPGSKRNEGEHDTGIEPYS